MIDLSQQQNDVIGSCMAEGDHYIFASAGTGKTTVAVEIIKASTGSIVALTFSRAAARELFSRILPQRGSLSRSCSYECRVDTIHGYAMHCLPGERQWTICPEAIDDTIRSEVSKLYKVTLGAMDEGVQTCFTSDVLTKQERAAKAYESRLFGLGYKTHAMVLRDATNEMMIAYHLRVHDPIDLLIVDEAQDCSVEDWAFIDSINARRRVFIGDRKQSVYQFRGARPDLFLKRSSTHTIYSLTHNYRSTQYIQGYANRLHGLKCEIEQDYSVQFLPDSPITADWIHTSGTHAILARTNNEVEALQEQLSALGINASRNDVVRRRIRQIGGISSAACSLHPEARILVGSKESERMDPTEAFLLAVEAETAGMAVHAALETLRPYSSSAQWIERALEYDVQPDPNFHLGTIHSAKGCEWDHVWISGVDWPMRTKPEGQEEQRNLMYVAMTRAKHTVTLSGPDLGFKFWLVKEMGL